jgi:putative molybdopterin biosynthesis protein
MRIPEPTAQGPIYRRLADELAARIAAGELAPGAALPTVRALADERGVDRNTVARAYALLAARGLVTAHGRHGTRVRVPVAPALAPPAPAAATGLRCAGSHDFCLDVLARHLRAAGVSMEFHLTGSSEGLRALAEGRAELAGAHLLDDDGADYNCGAVRSALPGRDVRLVTLVEREQGLIVPRGNPRGLRAAEDLAQPGLRIVNRQPGSGTRRLLDALLARAGVRPADLAGYGREVETHLAAAAAVAAGSADVALGVAAAARALDLDFAPLASERFDLVLLAESLAAPWFGPLIEALAAPAFRAEVEALGGYSAAHSAWIRRVEGTAPAAP